MHGAAEHKVMHVRKRRRQDGRQITRSDQPGPVHQGVQQPSAPQTPLRGLSGLREGRRTFRVQHIRGPHYEELEAEYLRIRARYTAEEAEGFAKLPGILVACPMPSRGTSWASST